MLGLPADFVEDDCIELLEGMLALATRDRHQSRRRRPDPLPPTLFLAITVVGHAGEAETLVQPRGGARQVTFWS